MLSICLEESESELEEVLITVCVGISPSTSCLNCVSRDSRYVEVMPETVVDIRSMIVFCIGAGVVMVLSMMIVFVSVLVIGGVVVVVVATDVVPCISQVSAKSPERAQYT